MFARLAEDRFNLVVVGRFSRGKASLMNALLGRALLPTGILPLTSVVTAVSHGSAPGVVLHHTDTSLTTDIPLKALADHVTERGNLGNRRRVRIAKVRLPEELLLRGFFLVDTPGFGSSVIENTRTAEAFLPEADALLLVTSSDFPLSEEELAVLRVARKAGRMAFVAVNKADAASKAERTDVMLHLDGQLRLAFGTGTPPFFAVSTRDGLAAQLAGDAEPGTTRAAHRCLLADADGA
ncbi:MAG: dynamin family protein [Janthinobacterium lividum]